MEAIRQTGQPPLSPNGDDLNIGRVLQAMPVAAYSTDADGLITYYNRLAALVWGREPMQNDPRDRY